MPKKAFVVFLISLMILPSGVMSVPHYGDLAVITDAKNNKLILQGDTVTIGNSTDTVVISRSDTGIDFNGAYFDGVNWEESDLENLDADQLDGLEGDSYLKSDRVDTFTGGKLIFDDNAITKIDWANSDDGPGSELDADLWDGNQYSDIDSDGDNQVDEADDADNVRSTYKSNDIDNDADGKVNESVDADNVKSTYKGNDIDDDSDGKVNNSDQLDGYEASEFATTSEADTQISVLDSQTFLGAVRNLDFDTDLNATVPGTDTAFIEVNEGSVDAGSVDGEDASDFASATGGAGSRQAQDSDKWDGNEYSRIDSNDDGKVDNADKWDGNEYSSIDSNDDGKVDSAEKADTSLNSNNSDQYDGVSPSDGSPNEYLKTDGSNVSWDKQGYELIKSHVSPDTENIIFDNFDTSYTTFKIKLFNGEWGSADQFQLRMDVSDDGGSTWDTGTDTSVLYYFHANDRGTMELSSDEDPGEIMLSPPGAHGDTISPQEGLDYAIKVDTSDSTEVHSAISYDGTYKGDFRDLIQVKGSAHSPIKPSKINAIRVSCWNASSDYLSCKDSTRASLYGIK